MTDLAACRNQHLMQHSTQHCHLLSHSRGVDGKQEELPCGMMKSHEISTTPSLSGRPNPRAFPFSSRRRHTVPHACRSRCCSFQLIISDDDVRLICIRPAPRVRRVSPAEHHATQSHLISSCTGLTSHVAATDRRIYWGSMSMLSRRRLLAFERRMDCLQ